MTREGRIVLFRFPQTDQTGDKLRPALVLRALPGRHDDWLVCMISSQVDKCVPGFDEIIAKEDPDFTRSRLKTASALRIARIAILESQQIVGTLGEIDNARLVRIQNRLADGLVTDK